MENCFICNKNIINDVIYIPRDDEYFGEDISIFKNTFIIKSIDSYKFVYYAACNICLNNYINIYNHKFQYIKNREIGKK
jgi:hypothetical protein